MKRTAILIAALLFSSLLHPAVNVNAQDNLPAVHAVLFYSPTCGHCEYVINEVLMPMIERYRDQLQIIGIDVTQQQGQVYFMSAMEKFKLESAGVPFLVVDDTYLIGSVDIPEKFPSMVETYLAQGGVDWPNIPGLDKLLDRTASQPQSTPEPSTGSSQESYSTAPADAFTAVPLTQTATLQSTPDHASVSKSTPTPTATPGIIGISTHQANWRTTFARDPVGNTLSVIVLITMLGSIAWAVITFKNTDGVSIKQDWTWSIPLLCLIGFGVAGYLAYVETTNTTAICGPVGDCNTVQQSTYAHVFGILPIGILGLIGYAAIILSWMVARYARKKLADLATVSIFFLTLFGTFFSLYLTFLEPFVIGATCAWCLTSAVLMTLLMLITLRPAKVVISKSI